MSYTDNQFWYANETQNFSYYYIPQLEVVISTSGNQSTINNFTYPVDVISGSSLYSVNIGRWKAGSRLQDIGNNFYATSVTGVYNVGDVIRTMYISPDGGQYIGTSFQVVDKPAVDLSSLSGMINSAVQNAVKNITFSPTIILKAN